MGIGLPTRMRMTLRLSRLIWSRSSRRLRRAASGCSSAGVSCGRGWSRGSAGSRAISSRLSACMGHQPLEAIDVLDVASVFLGSFAINPVNKHAFMELHGELSDLEMEKFLESVKRQFGPTINPGDWERGRKLLTLIVNEQVERLEAIALEHEENREVYVEERTARLRDDETPDGERFKRYDLASSRVLGRGLEAVWKHRRNVVKGIEDGVELSNHSDVGKRFMMGDGSGTEILICSDGLGGLISSST